ncbi:MAG TPA: putative Ig domain-containing protein, partial [Longimicrobiales bacterium]|nr:putative Ig domain-containing protein [Longimicrobiales bacterium]
DGLSLDASGGEISGTPTALGAFDFTVEAASDGQTGDQALSITIGPAPVGIDTDRLDTAYPGATYSDFVEASGGDGPFSWAVTAGSLPDGLSLDPSTGEISGSGGTPGAYYFTVTVANAGETASKTYAVAISTRPATAFNMGISNIAGNTIPSAAVVQHLSEALARWEEVITEDLGDVTYGPNDWSPGSVGASLNGQTIDDMEILVNLANIDGPGATLGSAGPRDVRVLSGPVNFATIFGRLTLDTSDLDSLDDHQLFSLFFHEIAHIVGVGTLWPLFSQFGGTDLISGEGTADPRYEGTGANDVYTGVLGGPSSGVDTRIPIEAEGGTGTRDGHWDEGEFDTEIMTGWAEASGIDQPVSTMTIAAVGDFAYTVDTGAADPYALPVCAPFCTAAPPAPGARKIFLDDISAEPIRALLPDGTVLWVDPRRDR